MLMRSSVQPPIGRATRVKVSDNLYVDFPCRNPSGVFDWLKTQCNTDGYSSRDNLTRYTVGARGIRFFRDSVDAGVEWLFSGRRRDIAERLGYLLPLFLCNRQLQDFQYNADVLQQRGLLGARRTNDSGVVLYQLGENTRVEFDPDRCVFYGYAGRDSFATALVTDLDRLYRMLLVHRSIRH
jgi:hypothetical protein